MEILPLKLDPFTNEFYSEINTIIGPTGMTGHR